MMDLSGANRPLADQLAETVRVMLGRTTSFKALPIDSFPVFAPVYAELRQSGRLVASGWESRSSPVESLECLLGNWHDKAAHATDLLLCFTGDSHLVPLDTANWNQLTAKVNRGIWAYEFRLRQAPSRQLMISPFSLVAQNRGVENALERFLQSSSLTISQARAGQIEARQFHTRQFWIDLRSPSAPAVELFRGRRLVLVDECTADEVSKLSRLVASYLVQAVQPDGRIVYRYLPSRGSEDFKRDNSIRQWMATRALVWWWNKTKDAAVRELLLSNIHYNLGKMYERDGEFGLICEGDKVKLGAIALAALALIESPFAAQFKDVVDRLQSTVIFLWQDDGAFRTFYRPPYRNDCQNFYPGEALLLWSCLIGKSRDASLIERFWRSFHYYQKWHLANRNPAFVPWHTQACARLFRSIRDERLSDAIFNMNDWLLPVQQWESAPQPDCRGRFYDPQRPFGPPHASSTAVYLEGLTDAFALAKELGAVERADRYRAAILRGVRSLMQLTFRDACDMFYVSRRQRVQGGVRTVEYDNVVRIDNVQHALMALMKVQTELSSEDYLISTPAS